MANLSKVIYINEEDYSTLLNGGTITKGGVTYSHDPTALYVIKNVSAPEYAETAGYATTAGQATKATQDGGGNVISETYAKKVIIGELSYDDQNDLYSCNKTYSQLSSALLGGDIVLLKDSDDLLFYPTNHPYQEEGEAVGPLRFRYIGDGGYDESYRINSDNTIIYNYEDTFDESIYYQRTVLKLTIDQNNALTFKDQDNNTITATRAYYTLTNNRNDRDVVIQYSGCEYHKSSFGHLDELSFSSVDNGIISYLVFNCSTADTVTLVSTGYNYILTENVDFGQGYGTSSNDATAASRTASIPGFTLKEGGIVSIKFTYDVPANATLNISSTGAKSIYNKGAAITAGIIKGGDIATFIYDGTHYQLLSVDSWQDKAAAPIELFKWFYVDNFPNGLPESEENARVLTQTEASALEEAAAYPYYAWTILGAPAFFDLESYENQGFYEWYSSINTVVYELSVYKTQDNKYWYNYRTKQLLTSTDISAWAKASTKPSYSANEISGLTNDIVDISDGTANDGAVVFTRRSGDTVTLNFNHTHSQYALASSLSAVATSGEYSDLLNKPTIPTLDGCVQSSSVTNIVMCQNQAAYDAISPKDSATLYLIAET